MCPAFRLVQLVNYDNATSVSLAIHLAGLLGEDGPSPGDPFRPPSAPPSPSDFLLAGRVSWLVIGGNPADENSFEEPEKVTIRDVTAEVCSQSDGSIKVRGRGRSQSDGSIKVRGRGRNQSDGSIKVRGRGRSQSDGSIKARSRGRSQSDGSIKARSRGRSQSDGSIKARGSWRIYCRAKEPFIITLHTAHRKPTNSHSILSSTALANQCGFGCTTIPTTTIIPTTISAVCCISSSNLPLLHPYLPTQHYCCCVCYSTA
eukprot:1180641-Prorocentrum_minimum.AAC.3